MARSERWDFLNYLGLLWQLDALCAEPEYSEVDFFATGKSTAAAKAICDRCAVRSECLAYARDNDIVDGIWGGLDPKERRPAGQRRARPKPPDRHGG